MIDQHINDFIDFLKNYYNENPNQIIKQLITDLDERLLFGKTVDDLLAMSPATELYSMFLSHTASTAPPNQELRNLVEKIMLASGNLQAIQQYEFRYLKEFTSLITYFVNANEWQSIENHIRGNKEFLQALADCQNALLHNFDVDFYCAIVDSFN